MLNEMHHILVPNFQKVSTSIFFFKYARILPSVNAKLWKCESEICQLFINMLMEKKGKWQKAGFWGGGCRGWGKHVPFCQKAMRSRT